MGQTSSSWAQKLTKPVSSWMSGGKGSVESSPTSNDLSQYHGVTPFIYKRYGSMFFDEDGDLAHEFYEEVVHGRKSRMKRCYKRLRPQGEVDLPHPCLNNQLPIIMCEASFKS
ncbi:hypothetical protein SNE40_015201 [Patella caerulea]|uniref:Tumor suppressor candidate 2 n=1 Tax=Patella caerulea TaxID=87958 RepID=A0AAN8JJA2_PATCE